MLYYCFQLAPLEGEGDGHGSQEARVMIRLNCDAFTATERAVALVEERGYRVTGVRQAQQADTIEEFVGDSTAIELYHAAADNGIACMLTAAPQARYAPGAFASKF